ncbi:hypothetical protein RJ640_022029 [Escallonia rubra]|uniref:aspartate kinase n=1 Tax=Escallonia rubra TaxID=112253 RepID=A0AA88QQL8_9ASTE|nr:hypothetical protein RJ640_022029 [Escallonia rubra]
MATTMHLCGARTVKTPNPRFALSALRCQLWRRQCLDFAVSVGSVSKLCRTVEGSCRGKVLRVSCQGGKVEVIERSERKDEERVDNEITCVMKFGGSSLASAERMREVAELILSFPEERPVIVLSAMGKTTNKLLLAGEKAVSCGVSNVNEINETVKELEIESSVISVNRSSFLLSACTLISVLLAIYFLGKPFSGHLEELEQLLKGIAMMKELTLRTKDYLVSFGECLSTRIFAAYLNKIGAKARQQSDSPQASLRNKGDDIEGLTVESTSSYVLSLQPTVERSIMLMTALLTLFWLIPYQALCVVLQYDAFDIGFITTDDFTNADILEATYPAVAKRLHLDWISDPAIPIVTGFLGKGWKTCAVTTLGRGGSDLTATTIGKALGLREIQVWKDVDGVLTCDPNIHASAKPVPYLTYDEAAELAYFGAQVLHPQSMRPARESDIPVRVKNSYNPKAPGTLITRARDMSEAELTSIVLKRNVTMLDIVSTRMLGQFGFLAKVFSTFEELGISVDVVATSEVSISLTLDPSKLWSRELIQQASELDHVVEELEKIAVVNLLQRRSIISLIGNVERSSLILEKVLLLPAFE